MPLLSLANITLSSARPLVLAPKRDGGREGEGRALRALFPAAGSAEAREHRSSRARPGQSFSIALCLDLFACTAGGGANPVEGRRSWRFRNTGALTRQRPKKREGEKPGSCLGPALLQASPKLRPELPAAKPAQAGLLTSCPSVSEGP